MAPFKACSEALRLNSAAEAERSEGDEAVLTLPIEGRCRPAAEVTERNCCFGVVLGLCSDI